MRMLAMNSLMHDAERRRQERRSRNVSPDTDKDDSDDDSVDVKELDPVDGFPSPPARLRPRRRFVKPGQTTYELSFSRRHAAARRRAAAANPKPEDKDESPVVSSLSSVLTEVMTGQNKALNNIVDTTQPKPNVKYVVEHAADGTPYVAASDGNKYFENSTIGQIFLKPAPVPGPEQAGPRGRRSDLDFLQSGGWQSHQRPNTRRSDFVGDGAVAAPKQDAAGNDIDAKQGGKTLLGFKGFHVGKKKKTSDLKVMHEHDGTVVLDSADAVAHADHELPMLDPDKVDRNRADSSWELPAPKPEAQQPAELEVHHATVVDLLDMSDGPIVHQAKTDALTGSTASNDSGVSGGSSLSSISAASSTSSSGTATKTLPRLQPKKDLPAPPLPFDAYDEDDNPLCRSFQNVRDVDLIRSNSHDEDEDEGHGHEDEREHDDAAADGDEGFPDVNSPDFAGRVRVSSGATSVAEFVGGFKGQLSRRSGASGLVNRKRAVRHARLTAAEQKAADLARKIREAQNRIPLEFRDEYMSLSAQNELKKKKKWSSLGRHIRFNPDVQCREFEVESEDEDEGYESPDEIVDAVQLVSKRDVVHAEDVVAAFPMEQLELPPEEAAEPIVRGFDAPSPLAPGLDADASESVQDDPLTFSQLNNDKRMSFSDL